MIYHPAPYQREGTRNLLAHRHFGLLFDPGLGKTATVLHAVKALSLAQEDLKVLVIAPRLVCLDTWPNEIEKWDQFKDLGYVQLRDHKTIDFERPETLWLINPELPRISKLFAQLDEYCKDHPWPFDVLVVDESSKFKNPGSKRFKLLKQYLDRFPRRYILTGTFAPNGLMDVFSQQYIMDTGTTFGGYITHFRSHPGTDRPLGHEARRRETPRPPRAGTQRDPDLDPGQSPAGVRRH
jgi:superfamily II DNA or RNA helicase